MSVRTRSLASLALATLLLACPSPAPPPAAAADAGAGSADAGSASEDGGADSSVWIRVFHTSDEHGWLAPYEDSASATRAGGVAELLATWRAERGFDPERDLLLSSGDNWAGAAISSWFDGEPAVAAMNAMGYQASAAGNHEFDQGPALLATRAAQADFPYLAANVFERRGEVRPAFIKPWVVLERGGVRVGVIGLGFEDTARAVIPRLVAGLAFTDPVQALQRELPTLRRAGAQVVVLLAHECGSRVLEILQAAGVSVDLALAGHCHQQRVDLHGLVPVLSSGRYWRSYGLAQLRVDPASGVVRERLASVHELVRPLGQPAPIEPDPALQALVDGWQGQLDSALGEQVAYTQSGIEQSSWLQANWVTDAWRWAFPQADLAVLNFGSMRQSLPPGPITRADLVGMLPFENLVYEVRITGAMLQADLEAAAGATVGARSAVSGFSYSQDGDEVAVTLASGEPLDLAAEYRVLVTDFMYFGGSDYLFEEQDPAPDNTEQNYRQPLLDWCLAHPSDAASPVELHLDSRPRGE